jgi:hypothetical protein
MGVYKQSFDLKKDGARVYINIMNYSIQNNIAIRF